MGLGRSPQLSPSPSHNLLLGVQGLTLVKIARNRGCLLWPLLSRSPPSTQKSSGKSCVSAVDPPLDAWLTIILLMLTFHPFSMKDKARLVGSLHLNSFLMPVSRVSLFSEASHQMLPVLVVIYAQVIISIATPQVFLHYHHFQIGRLVWFQADSRQQRLLSLC